MRAPVAIRGLAGCAVALAILAGGCSMPQTTGPLPGPAAAAATSAPWTQVEVCGAAFGLPAGWRSRQLHSGHWRLAQESGQGVVVDVRCLPSLRFPNDRWDEIAEVAAALELGQADWPQQDQLRYLLWIEGRRDAVQGRVSNLIALRREPRETHSHGLRRQVALWPLDGDCDRDALPCSALLSMHWSADVPAQQAGYEALSAAMAQTLQLPEPNF